LSLNNLVYKRVIECWGARPALLDEGICANILKIKD